ncbi:MAG: peptidase T [Lactobacillaceae bacterium]|jgi:tripeptide aminopeptidase|nr:peptidase T [Lactobacillaceae bacterium]
MAKYENLVDRFLKYVKVNTKSDEFSQTVPSDPKEVAFLKDLAEELKEIGFSNVRTLKDGYVFAEVPATPGKENVDAIGFISHVDTADFNSENVNPQVVTDYDGQSVVKLNDEYSLDPEVFSSLKKYKGHTLITTDGTTLLGADDKAGVSEIIAAGEYMLNHPEFEHGKVVVAFGPDEEIGIGADNFDTKEFGAKFAYTMDGGPLGELEWETFSGAGATLTATGKAVHPGTAKDLLVNPAVVLIDVFNQLPEHDRPENTEGREGFFYLTTFEADADKGVMRMIIRDHDRTKFEERKQMLTTAVENTNKKYGDAVVLVLKDQYYNMGEILKDQPEAVDVAKTAMNELGITPIIEPVRGGTDGSKITFLGTPTPNLFAGGENMHGRFEYVSTTVMEQATDLILKIVELEAK